MRGGVDGFREGDRRRRGGGVTKCFKMCEFEMGCYQCLNICMSVHLGITVYCILKRALYCVRPEEGL